MLLCCCPPTFACGAYFLPGTLFLTDVSLGATCALTYNPTSLSWFGTLVIPWTIPACCAGYGSADTTATVAYNFNCSGMVFTFGQIVPQSGCAGSTIPPNFTLSGLYTPVTASVTSISYSGGVFSASLSAADGNIIGWNLYTASCPGVDPTTRLFTVSS